jgi:hypothetical protein
MGNEHPWSAPVSAATVGPVELRLPVKRDKAILAQNTICYNMLLLTRSENGAILTKRQNCSCQFS